MKIRKYLYSVNWQLFEKLVRVFSGLIVGVWVARYLGPNDFGILSWGLSVIGIFSTLATLGLDSLVTRELAKGKEDEYVLLGSALFLRLCGSTAMCAVILIYTLTYVDNELSATVLMTLSMAGFVQVALSLEYYFQSEVRGDLIAKCRIYALLIVALFKVILVYFQCELFFFAIAFLLDGMLLSLFYIGSIKSIGFDLKILKLKTETCKNLLKDSWPLIFSGFVMSIYMKVDQIMINDMLDSRSVGIYAAAVRISEAFNFVPVTICAAIFPLIVKSRSESKLAFDSKMVPLHSAMFWLSIVLSSAFFVLGDTIINTLYGVEYKEAINVIKIHAWSAIAVFISVSTTSWIISENLQKYKLIQDVLGAVLNVILNLIFIPKLGVIGAAYATLISYSSTILITHVFISRLRKNLKLILLGVVYPIQYILGGKSIEVKRIK